MEQNKEISRLQSVITRLERELDFLKRENNRRKSEIQQLVSVIRRG